MSFDSRFMCICSPEGLAECEAIYDQVMERTKARDDRDFLSAVIYGIRGKREWTKFIEWMNQ